MDCMKSYFEYRCYTRSGIKAVKLLGNEEDWDHLLQNVQALRQYDLDWWIDYIEPIVVNIIKTFKGEEINDLFWKSIYKHHDGRGSGQVPTVDGWITTFFPYSARGNSAQRSRYLATLEEIYARANRIPFHCPGYPEKSIPNGVAKTPFLWIYLGNEIKMEFHSGFIGVEMGEDENVGKIVTPAQFWAVAQVIQGTN